MHLASENGHDDVAEILLQNRAYVGVKSKLGVTPLHLAAQNGYIKLVKLLVELYGATIDAMTLVKNSNENIIFIILIFKNWACNSFVI